MRSLLLFLAVLATPLAAQAQKFEFFALGDTPYADVQRPHLDRLIDRINAARPSFSVHVGDTKSGGSSCANATIERSKDQLDRFAGALVYTPGDNEWTDCHRITAGGWEPVERLAFVRALHFPAPRSLGQSPIAVQRQADAMPEYGRYVENARWRFGEVLFVTVHIVGSNNNRQNRPGAREEYEARDQANQAWIADAFEGAARQPTRGIVFAFQADIWAQDVPRDPAKSGFTRTLANFAAHAAAFRKPVLLINGDSHYFVVDKPLRNAAGRTVPNVTRLMVMGDKDVHAVRVAVDPAKPGLFTCTAFLVADNPVGAASIQAGDANCDGTSRPPR